MASKAIHLHNAPPHLNRIVDRLFRVAFEASAAAFLKDSLFGWGPMLSLPQTSLLPSMNDTLDAESPISANTAGVLIQQTDNGIVINIEVAHLKADSIYLEISGEILIVRGECNPDEPLKQDSAWSNPDGLHYERFITLPVTARPGKIRARLIDRMIKIEIDTK